jgi:hypothetical protein
MIEFPNWKQNRFYDWKLVLGIYLGFGNWNVGFQTRETEENSEGDESGI